MTAAAGDTPPTGDLSLTEAAGCASPGPVPRPCGSQTAGCSSSAVCRVPRPRKATAGSCSTPPRCSIRCPGRGWTPVMSVPRTGAAAVRLADGRVLVTGGRPIPRHAHDPMGLSTSEVLDPHGRLQPIRFDGPGTLGSHSDHVVRRSRAGRRRHRAGRGGQRPRPVRGQDNPWRRGGGRFPAGPPKSGRMGPSARRARYPHARGPRGGPAAG